MSRSAPQATKRRARGVPVDPRGQPVGVGVRGRGPVMAYAPWLLSSGAGPLAAAASSDPALPFRHSMPYSDHDCDRIDPALSRPDERQSYVDHQTDTDTELVTETLVEEVSIDGMCGVY